MANLPSHHDRPIAVEGQNCWRRALAERLAFLVDGQAYFQALKAALVEARRSVIIVGWEFDSRVRLERAADASEPDTIGELLRLLVRTRPALEIHLLIWNPALIYSFDREFLPVVKHHWLTHPRLHFRLDDSHPFGASHHQKIVVIDDRVAFLGGLDISSKRWDTPQHLADDARRNDPGFPDYAPFHDVQVMVSGPAAAALGDLARWRWRNATGRRLAPPPRLLDTPWPSAAVPDLEEVTVAMARTLPPWEGEPPVREVERLFVDMIEAAESTLYIENQYFASRAVARTLARRLAGGASPEIAMVTSGFSAGFLERTAMGASRARLQAHLSTQDHSSRLRFYAPMSQGIFLKVHAKVMVVDDRLLRVGSANLNNRSMGLDTECDLLIEAEGKPALARAIAGFRARLLGEHLGRSPEEVAEAVARRGLHATIGALATSDRRLEPLQAPPPITEPLPEAELLDPEAPIETLLLAATPPTRWTRPPLAAKFITGFVLLAVLTLGIILWHQLSLPPWPAVNRVAAHVEVLKGHPFSALLVGGMFLLVGLTGLPIFLLVTAVGWLFGAWPGGVYSMLGALASAAFTYSLGRAFGRDFVRRLTGARANRVSRALVRHGVIAMAMLRIMPVASFTAVNLMAGASRIRQSDFYLGSLAGLLPMVLAFSLFGEAFAAAVKTPDAYNTGMLILFSAVVFALGHTVVARLSRAAPAIPRQRVAPSRGGRDSLGLRRVRTWWRGLSGVSGNGGRAGE
jgi:phospholipase D1/2